VATDIAGNSSSSSITVDYEDTSCGEDYALLLTLDEESAGTAADESPNSLNGTGVSTTQVTGVHGNATLFDGSNSYMTVPHDAAISLADEFSVELWYRRDGPSGDYEVLAMKGNYNYALVVYKDYIAFTYTDSTGDTPNVFASGFNDGDWHHVVGVYDGSNVLIYVDGGLENTDSAGTEPATNSNDLYLGGFGPGSYNLDGAIDQVRVHAFALSSGEVSDLFEEPPACMPGDNLAPSGSASASQTYGPLYGATNVIDEDTNEDGSRSYWILPNSTTGWVEVDLGSSIGITDILWANTHNQSNFDRATTDYEIAVSETGSFSGEETIVDSGTGSLEADLVFHSASLSTPVSGRYIRFYVDGYFGSGGGLNELQIFGVE
jgi:hypothetical protein